jgi:hypothetical protein
MSSFFGRAVLAFNSAVGGIGKAVVKFLQLLFKQQRIENVESEESDFDGRFCFHLDGGKTSQGPFYSHSE